MLVVRIRYKLSSNAVAPGSHGSTWFTIKRAGAFYGESYSQTPEMSDPLRVNPSGRVEKATLRGGMNSRPYGRQLLIIHRAGHLALPKGFFNSPFRIHPDLRLMELQNRVLPPH